MYEFKALIFDVDGTLADTERDGHRPAFNAAFSEVGLDWVWSEDLYGELLRVTGGKERIRHYIECWQPAFLSRTDLDELIADLHRRKTRHFVELLKQGQIPLRQGVKRLLRQARDAGVRLAIATTTTPENVTALLEHSAGKDVLGWFEVIVAGDIVPAKKPAPDIFFLALEELGLDARQCVVVEDSVNGLRAALAAELRALLVTVNGYTEAEDFSGAALVTDGLGDPGQPVEVLRGALEGSDHVELEALEAMHRRVYATG